MQQKKKNGNDSGRDHYNNLSKAPRSTPNNARLPDMLLSGFFDLKNHENVWYNNNFKPLETKNSDWFLLKISNQLKKRINMLKLKMSKMIKELKKTEEDLTIFEKINNEFKPRIMTKKEKDEVNQILVDQTEKTKKINKIKKIHDNEIEKEMEKHLQEFCKRTSAKTEEILKINNNDDESDEDDYDDEDDIDDEEKTNRIYELTKLNEEIEKFINTDWNNSNNSNNRYIDNDNNRYIHSDSLGSSTEEELANLELFADEPDRNQNSDSSEEDEQFRSQRKKNFKKKHKKIHTRPLIAKKFLKKHS